MSEEIQPVAPALAEAVLEAPPAPAPESVTLSKEDHDKLLADLGSLKRENKDLKKPKEQQEPSAPDELLQKTYLRAANIVAEDEVELALSTAKKWDMPVDKLVDDEDFKAKLEKLRTSKANDAATSGIPGSPGSRSVNDSPEFYISRGMPPTAQEVPDRSARAKIARAMIAHDKDGGKGKYYNG